MPLFESWLPKKETGEARYLRVLVVRGGETRVDLSLPAGSARWLLQVIPEDVLEKARGTGLELDRLQQELAASERFTPRELFVLEEPERTVKVWLE